MVRVRDCRSPSVWRPYTPRGLGGLHGDASSKRDPRQRRGGDERGRGESADAPRRFPAPKGTFVPAPAPRRGAPSRADARRGDDGREMAWRRGQDTERAEVPAWLSDDAGARRPPTSAAGRVDSIQEFKAQMREKERREKGEPAEPPARRSMYEDMAHEEDTGGHASRFARFFSPDAGKGSEEKASSTPAVEFDLFSLIQGKKDSGSSTPRAQPSVAAAPTPPAATPLRGAAARGASLAPLGPLLLSGFASARASALPLDSAPSLAAVPGTTLRAIGRALGSGTLSLARAMSPASPHASVRPAAKDTERDFDRAVERNAAARAERGTAFLCGG